MGTSEIAKFAENLMHAAQGNSGKIVGEDVQSTKRRLAKDDKGAMVNDIVDKYMAKELTDEYLQEVKEEFGITTADITREIARREIEKIMRI